MRGTSRLFLCSSVVAAFAATAPAIDLYLTPVGGTGTVAINTAVPLATDITIDPGETIRIDVSVANWVTGGELLRAVQIELMIPSQLFNTAGTLAIENQDDSPANAACDFAAALCPLCGPPFDLDGVFVDGCRKRCNNAAGSICNPGNAGTCPGEGGIVACIVGYADHFGQLAPISGTGSASSSVANLALLWAGTNAVGAADDGNVHHVGAYVFTASLSARGTATITQWASPCVGCNVNGSFVRNQNSQAMIQPTNLGLARVHIRSGSCCVGQVCTPNLTAPECLGVFRPGVDCSGGCECATDSDCTTPPGGFSCLVGDCVGVGGPGADIQGCAYNQTDSACDDGVACTTNDCVGAGGDVDGCVYTAVNANCDDSIPCTDDTCDAVLDCVYTPNDGNCSDASPCTNNLCTPGGGADANGCTFPTDTCTTIADCNPGAVACVAGNCVCAGDPPRMCIDAVDDGVGAADCFGLGNIITVQVRMDPAPSGLTATACGAQFFLSYDRTHLDFLAISPGDTTPGGASNAFEFEVFEFVNEAAGTIDYAIGPPVGSNCIAANAPAVIAIIRFRAIAACDTADPAICFRVHNPDTKFASDDGDEIIPAGHNQTTGDPCTVDDVAVDPDCAEVACCLGGLTIDNVAPTLDCPFSGVQNVNADCQEATRNIEWDAITASDNCDDDVDANCSATYYSNPIPCVNNTPCGGGTCNLVTGYCGAGTNRADLLDGGDFPIGCTAIRCTATDDCDNSTSCSFDICNSGLNRICVDVELSPSMVNATVGRGMEFTASDCGDVVGDGVVYCQDMNFGPPFFVAGHSSVCFDIQPGNWLCLEARDPAHSLRATCTLVCEDSLVQDPNTGELVDFGSIFRASFKGSPDIEEKCHWLVQGNLNGDETIDILDFALFIGDQGCTTITTDCDGIPETRAGCLPAQTLDGLNDDEGTHSDFNGNGVVNAFDFSFILIDFFDNDKEGCDVVCDNFGASTDGAGIVGRDSIRVRELHAMGLGNQAAAADLNHDGVVNMTDIAIYLNGDAAAGEDQDSGVTPVSSRPNKTTLGTEGME